MKIILADPPNIQTPWMIANHPNLGILYLASCLRHSFKDVRVHYLESYLTLEEHLRKVQEISPDIYGISFASLRLPEAEATIRRVRTLRPQIPILCGGPYPTAMARHTLETMPVDVCVRGEGEETLKELLQAYQQATPLEGIKGIVFRKNSQIVETPPRSLIVNLDSIPFPAWDLVDFARYAGNYQYRGSPSTALIASRGCPFDCVFCANPVWKLSKPWLRLRSPQNIAQEALLLYGRGIREISIRSDEFNPSLRWTLEVCQALTGLGLKDLYFQGNLRADPVNDELAAALRRANFWLVQVGVESGNQRTLDGIGKHVTLDQVVEACRCFKRHGLKVYGYIMTYHVWEEEGRLCYETARDVDNTFEFVRQLRREHLIDYMSFSATTPMPGSRLYGIALRHGIMQRDQVPRDMSEMHMRLPGVSPRVLKRSRFKGMLLQMSINLRSRRNNLSDWGKNWHKLKTFLRSI